MRSAVAATALVLSVSGGLRADLATSLADARRTYDLVAAEAVLDGARSDGPDETLLVEATVLVAELQRLEFETTPKEDRERRRELGDRIDTTAEEGLEALDRLAESSERERMRADLLATLIRSKFRGKKYLKRLNAAARRALELDGGNALAWVSLAKPPAFRPGRDDTDRREALEYLGRALEFDPNLEAALVLRGRVLDELGDRPGARADWRAVLERNADCRPARDLLADSTETP